MEKLKLRLIYTSIRMGGINLTPASGGTALAELARRRGLGPGPKWSQLLVLVLVGTGTNKDKDK